MIVSWFKGSEIFPLGEKQMHGPILQEASLWTLFWGQSGPKGVRENGWTAVLQVGIFLPFVQLTNETNRDSSKCTRRTGSLVSVTRLLVAWGGSKGKLLQTPRIWALKELGKNLVLGKTLCLPGMGLKRISKHEAARGLKSREQTQADARGPRSKQTQQHFCLSKKV